METLSAPRPRDLFYLKFGSGSCTFLDARCDLVLPACRVGMGGMSRIPRPRDLRGERGIRAKGCAVPHHHTRPEEKRCSTTSSKSRRSTN